MSAPPKSTTFAWSARGLHWVMAAMLLSMLFIGVAMVSSLADYHRLVGIHRPLGIGILILAIVRIVVRRRNPPPDFLTTMSARERFVASQSERLIYVLMVTLPLVGWGMLSAESYPIVLFGSVHLPPILPASPTLYSALRTGHTILAYLLFFTFCGHLSGVLFHALVVRDGILKRMVPWTTTPTPTPTSVPVATTTATANSTVDARGLVWHDVHFSALGAAKLYEICTLRQRIFVVEQNCPYVDADGLDIDSRHLWAEEDGAIVAYLRIVPAGAKFDEISIGRVVTAAAQRKKGLGRILMKKGLEAVGNVKVRIGAQAHLEKFYGELGFVRASDVYDEDGIPHIEMTRTPKSG